MKKALVYTRVSTPKQANSLQGQFNYIKDYMRNRYELDRSYEDIGSGSDISNFNINRLKNHNNSLILIRDISRLGRNSLQVTGLINRLREQNNRIYSIIEGVYDSNPYFLDRIIEAQRQLKVQKDIQKTAIETIKKNGGYIGRSPYGYKIVSINNIPMLMKFESEYKNVRKIVNFVNLGIPINLIVDRLNECDYDNNTFWTCKKVKTIYEREKDRIKLNND